MFAQAVAWACAVEDDVGEVATVGVEFVGGDAGAVALNPGEKFEAGNGVGFVSGVWVVVGDEA